MSPSLVAGIAGLVTLAAGVAAFTHGYRMSARFVKREPPSKLSDQAAAMAGEAGLISWLLPRPLKSAWGWLCYLTAVIVFGVLSFAAVADSDYGSVHIVAIKIAGLALWSGLMCGLGAFCEQFRGRKLSL